MDARPVSDWPEAVGTWKDHTGDPVQIEVYTDHEFPECAAFYLCFPNGSKQPARTVDSGNWNHWERVLTAMDGWYRHIPMIDLRTVKEPPLPRNVPNWVI